MTACPALWRKYYFKAANPKPTFMPLMRVEEILVNAQKRCEMFYIKNLPVWERILRSVVGVAAAVYALLAIGGVGGWVILAASVVMVLTGLVGFCPACALAGRRLQKRNTHN
jgi:uncharacterized protein (DUF983 family)